MNHETSIVEDDRKFRGFLGMLNEEYKSLKKAQNFRISSKMDDITKGVIGIRDHFIDYLIDNRQVSTVQAIEQNMKDLYDPFFESSALKNRNKLLKKVKKNPTDYFYNKKIAHLCHLHGIRDAVCKETKVRRVFLNYTQLSLFLVVHKV